MNLCVQQRYAFYKFQGCELGAARLQRLLQDTSVAVWALQEMRLLNDTLVLPEIFGNKNL